MASNVWQLQEAKSRFSELVETVILKGAQTVTKHGKPAVVIVSAEEYERSLAPRKSLVAALRACPEDLTTLVAKRPKQVARKVDFG
ncbi:MAG: type II toxin-antitoxin system Phd/YefM family antitoxin [Verrucomicrobiales bacterium]|nr:type II toxin-antitoxin system Phd/YefM family antitoxin [Verrucomicrobiales bacterium]